MSKKIEEDIGVDMARLRKMLGRAFEGDVDSVRRSLQKKEESRILDIACGACSEAETLTDFLADLRGQEGSKIKLTGIDMRAREINDAQRRFQGQKNDNQSGADREFEFLTGDATKLDGHNELGNDFDLVFLRHQNYWNGIRTWEEIFDNALGKLGPDGRLVITSYFDKEHALALDAIQRLGGKLIQTESNPDSRELTTQGKSVDRHVAVFRREDFL